MQMTKWAYIRFILIVSGIWFGYEASSFASSFWVPVEWWIPLLFLVISPLMVLIVAVMNHKQIDTWRRPDWNLYPFRRDDPLQTLHLVALMNITAGLTAAVRIPWIGLTHAMSGLIFGAGGIGFWLGLQLVLLIYRNRIQPSNSVT